MRTRFEDPLIEDALIVMEAGPADPGYDAAWNYLLQSREPAIQSMMREALETVYGPMPRPTGYNDDGEPFWTTETIAGYLQVDVREVDELAEDVFETCPPDSGVMETERLHRVQ